MKKLSIALMAMIVCGCGQQVQTTGNGHNFKTSQNNQRKYDPSKNLELAVKDQSRILVMQALAENADPNFITEDGIHILNIAIQTGNFEIVQKLISAGADINATNCCDNEYALLTAIKHNQELIAKYLISLNAKLDYKDRPSPLLLAMQAQMNELAEALILKNIDLTWDESFGPSAFEMAKTNKLNSILTLLDTAIALKEKRVDLDFVTKILIDGDTKSLTLIKELHKDQIKRLANKNNLISLAILHDNLEIRYQLVKILLSAGLSPDGEMDDQNIPLIHAIESNDLSISQLLIESGANLNKTDMFGKTALVFATKKLYLEQINLLITNGALIEYETLINGRNYFFQVCRYIPNKRYLIRTAYQNLSQDEIRDLYSSAKDLLGCK